MISRRRHERHRLRSCRWKDFARSTIRTYHAKPFSSLAPMMAHREAIRDHMITMAAPVCTRTVAINGLRALVVTAPVRPRPDLRNFRMRRLVEKRAGFRDMPSLNLYIGPENPGRGRLCRVHGDYRVRVVGGVGSNPLRVSIGAFSAHFAVEVSARCPHDCAISRDIGLSIAKL